MKKNNDSKYFAGFWIRLIAYHIDILIIGIVVLLLLGVIHGNFVEGYIKFISIDDSDLKTDLIRYIMFWLYFSVMEHSFYQATIGKIILGIKVTDISGNRLSYLKATSRFFAKFLSAFIVIGFLMIAFTKKKQGFHDIITGTIVIKK